MASIGQDSDIALGITGHFPVSEDRAAELAGVIARCLDHNEGVQALCELLLGIAPMSSFENLNEADRLRTRNPQLTFDPREVSRLLGDLWARYCAALKALEALFSYTPEFERAFREYAESLHQSPEEEASEQGRDKR